jgi:hypothetical protein
VSRRLVLIAALLAASLVLPSYAHADPPTLVAGYAFDEGSGGVANDASGAGHIGNISGATWVGGRHGMALSFNGTDASVDLGALGTFYQSGFTLEAWVKKTTATKNDVTVVGSWTPSGGPMLWVDHIATRYQLVMNVGLANYLDSGTNPVAGAWQHIAATYDGTTARFYIDGVEVASRAVSVSIGSSNSWRIGAYGSSAGGFFDGLIDDVRIYNGAITATQIQTDMNQPVAPFAPPPDTTPPSAPGTLTATGGFGQATLAWGAATDNVGVTTYDVYRSTTTGFTPTAADRIAQQSVVGYTDSSAAPGTYYYKVGAEDAAGNVGPLSNEATATVVPPDATPPSVAISGPTGGTISGSVTVAANASDNQTVAGVQFKVDGQNLGPEDTTSPYSTSWDTRTALNGQHTLTAVARDGAGNLATSTPVDVTVSNAPVAGSGLQAAYSFDDGAGTSAIDASGNGKTATLSSAGWTTNGHFGGAVAFNGTSGEVDLPALGTFYKTGFTYEAWVYKQTSKVDVGLVGTWVGSQSGGAMLWIDHLSGHYRLTLGSNLANYLDSGRTPNVGQWQHVAATWDGTTAHIYIDGIETASETFTGNAGDSNTWRIGAYGSPSTGFLDGNIDNVRIYGRALSAAEIQSDMSTRLPAPDATPPSAPGALTATAAATTVQLNWAAATDNIGVTSYEVYRSTTAGFTPGAANRIAQPTGTSYVDAGLAGGIYYYRVKAADAGGNLGAPSNEATATVAGDTTPPSVAVTAPAAGTVSGTVNATADASDDQGVAGVQFKLDGQNLGAEDTTAPYSLSWDTRTAVNGVHTVTAVARDGANNQTTSAGVGVTVNNTGVSTTGLRAAYSFDEASGSLALDGSGNDKTATLNGATRTTSGKYGSAVALNGSSGEVDPPALGTFYKTGFTYEAWVYKQSSKKDVGVVGTWVGSQGGGAMIWIDHLSGDYRLALGGTLSNYLDSGRTPLVGQWQHVAATYDGTTARIYIDGTQTASSTFTGNIGSSNTWRIGAYGAPAGGFFDGNIDNVRVYDRALTAAEIQTDMVTTIEPDRTPPTVTSLTPASGAGQVSVGASVTAKFSPSMQALTINATSFKLTDAANNLVPASVSYDELTKVATLRPQAALKFGSVYQATLQAGGPQTLAGTALAADVSWSFTTESVQPPVLLVTSPTNPFSSYLAEILRNEGMDSFTTIDSSLVTASFLSGFDVVVLGDMALSATQVTALSGWVSAGGNLVAMRPDKQLAGLLGVTATTSTLANAYLKVDTSAPPGAGIVGSTIQFHGTADKYALNGATSVATLYSNAATATTNPAVTIRSVGTNGGQASAFMFDLARSVVYTRQGNPAWAGQERDGVLGIRPDDMFFGAKSGDVKPDWLDTSKIAIPQADEEQRLLANVITLMESDRLPLPRFWYLPRGLKAVVVMSGDDHSPAFAPGGTASNFDRFKALSPSGCVVANWECVRSTSWIFPDGTLTNAQAGAYQADGFEIGLHPLISPCPSTSMSQAQLSAVFDSQLSAFAAKYTAIPAPQASRTHCVYWPDWASEAKIELAHGIRMDGNYYHYSPTWIGSKPGFLNGGGFPMRFADLDGTTIDVYQENTNMTDESGQAYPATVNTLLDNALGSQGFYGAFGTNVHTDNAAPQVDDEAIVGAAQARGVPVISYKQLLDWTDGRNSSTIRSLSWSGGTLTFTTTVAAKANGLQTMLPVQGPSGTLNAITLAGSPVSYTVQTIKGIQYALFAAATGTYQASYS